MAMGMVELHKVDNIMHRVLNASSMLIVREDILVSIGYLMYSNSIWFECDVADFESSTGVVFEGSKAILM